MAAWPVGAASSRIRLHLSPGTKSCSGDDGRAEVTLAKMTPAFEPGYLAWLILTLILSAPTSLPSVSLRWRALVSSRTPVAPIPAGKPLNGLTAITGKQRFSPFMIFRLQPGLESRWIPPDNACQPGFQGVFQFLIQFIRNLSKISRPRLNSSLNDMHFRLIPARKVQDTAPPWSWQPIV